MIDGTYDITIHSPQGAQSMTIELETSGDQLQGRVRQGDQRLELVEPSYSGNEVSFKLKITTPMPLTLSLAATIDGDLINGTASVAGMKIPFDGKRV